LNQIRGLTGALGRSQMQEPIVIAIDGPAASGKGTLARRIATHLGLRHLDTGLTYRAVAHALVEVGLPLDDAAIAAAAAEVVDFSALDRQALSGHETGEAASRIAVIPQVRRVLVARQREFAQTLPGAVLDGRDIGTVVCPDAIAKLYVTASAAVRAQRRYDEIRGQGGSSDYARILADIERRDARDMGRDDSPLKPAPDAHLIDTSEMGIEAAFHAALSIVERSLPRR
jgi:CMP/dCMP kinase